MGSGNSIIFAIPIMVPMLLQWTYRSIYRPLRVARHQIHVCVCVGGLCVCVGLTCFEAWSVSASMPYSNLNELIHRFYLKSYYHSYCHLAELLTLPHSPGCNHFERSRVVHVQTVWNLWTRVQISPSYFFYRLELLFIKGVTCPDSCFFKKIFSTFGSVNQYIKYEQLSVHKINMVQVNLEERCVWLN